jgi:hypothetical protein
VNSSQPGIHSKTVSQHLPPPTKDMGVRAFYLERLRPSPSMLPDSHLLNPQILRSPDHWSRFCSLSCSSHHPSPASLLLLRVLVLDRRGFSVKVLVQSRGSLHPGARLASMWGRDSKPCSDVSQAAVILFL